MSPRDVPKIDPELEALMAEFATLALRLDMPTDIKLSVQRGDFEGDPNTVFTNVERLKNRHQWAEYQRTWTREELRRRRH